MPYQLNIIRQVVQGNLSPLYFPKDTSGQALFYKYLSAVPETCTRQVHAQFGQSTDQPIAIESMDVRLLDRYRPPVFVAQNHEVQVYEQHAGETLLSLVLRSLSLSAESIIEWYHWQDEKGGVHLELYADYPLEDLSFEEKRYQYYQKLLIEQLALVQQEMLQYIHQVSSVKKAQKYVQDRQNALLTYAGELRAHLDEVGGRINDFTGEYLITDVFRHIFLSIEDLMLFIAQNFKQYLDVHAYVPYQSSHIASVPLLEKYAVIREKFLQSAISEELFSVLNEGFLKFESIQAKPFTYLELRYSKKLIEELEFLIQEEKVDDFHLASALYQINYNSPAFLAYLMRCLDQKVETKVLIPDKLEVLYHFRKLSKQFAPKTRQAFKPGNANLEGQISEYIEEDILRYQQELTSQKSTSLFPISGGDLENHPEDLPKIPTKLSVKQWAYLIRLFFEVQLLPEGNKASVFRLFNQVLSTTNKKDLAEGSLYNRQYEADAGTQEVVREKLQEMLNYIRKDKLK